MEYRFLNSEIGLSAGVRSRAYEKIDFYQKMITLRDSCTIASALQLNGNAVDGSLQVSESTKGCDKFYYTFYNGTFQFCITRCGNCKRHFRARIRATFSPSFDGKMWCWSGVRYKNRKPVLRDVAKKYGEEMDFATVL